MPCDICLRSACNGECIQPPTLEDWIARADPEKWTEGPDEQPLPDPLCFHEWTYAVDINGGDVDLYRTCSKCQGYLTQNLFTEPEGPNCYVPGYGWMVI